MQKHKVAYLAIKFGMSGYKSVKSITFFYRRP